CRPADKTRSELYLNLLPELSSKSVALLDNPRIIAQFVGLERRTSRGGRDIIDHSPGAHDDLVNSVAGALLMAKPRAVTEARIHAPPHISNHQGANATTAPHLYDDLTDGSGSGGGLPESAYNAGRTNKIW